MRARLAPLAGVAVVLLAAGCGPRGCSRLKARLRGHGHEPTPVAASPARGPVLVVPRTPQPIVVDGELQEDAWRDLAARSGPFHDEATGGDAIPYSDARFLRDDVALYAVLYAGDEDLRATVQAHDGPVWLDDSFDMRFGAPEAKGVTSIIDVSVAGVVTDVREGPDGKRDASWESGSTVSVERDGTLNDPGGNDEEWVVEARIPLASLPGKTVTLGLRRCDTPKGAKRRCAIWSGTLVLDR